MCFCQFLQVMSVMSAQQAILCNRSETYPWLHCLHWVGPPLEILLQQCPQDDLTCWARAASLDQQVDACHWHCMSLPGIQRHTFSTERKGRKASAISTGCLCECVCNSSNIDTLTCTSKWKCTLLSGSSPAAHVQLWTMLTAALERWSQAFFLWEHEHPIRHSAAWTFDKHICYNYVCVKMCFAYALTWQEDAHPLWFRLIKQTLVPWQGCAQRCENVVQAYCKILVITYVITHTWSHGNTA